MIEHFSQAWPSILLIATVIGVIISWIATRASRRATSAAQAQTIGVYQQTIMAKDSLALTLAESTLKQTAIIAEERKDSDLRHEKALSGYRDTLEATRKELKEVTDKKGECMAELADLRARTDFKPVMEFLQEETRKSTLVQTQILSVLSVIAPVLERVMESLKMPSDTARKVEVVNTSEHPVPVNSQPA